MRLVPETLPRELARSLKPAWLLFGEEPLLVGESADLIRARAAREGFQAREVHFAGRGYDWAGLIPAARSLSLFAERRLMEIRLPTAKPGADGARVLSELASHTPPDLILLVITGAIEWAERNAAWVRAFDDHGNVVDVGRIPPEQLPAWIAGRLACAGLSAEPDALDLIAERCEGNLVAAQQQIERLALVPRSAPLTVEQVADEIADSARFDVFELGEAILSGDPGRVLRIVDGLEGEGEEPALVLWCLAEELRSLLQWRQDAGRDVRRLWRGGRRRQALLAQAAGRIPRARITELLAAAARADLIVKGQRRGRAWDELARLAVAAAGAPLSVT